MRGTVMEALPLAVFQEVTTFGESCTDLVMMNESISNGKSMDAIVEWRGAVKKAVKESGEVLEMYRKLNKEAMNLIRKNLDAGEKWEVEPGKSVKAMMRRRR